MLLGDDFARLRLELAADLATPRAAFEGLSRPRCPLDRCNILPGLLVARTVSMMQRIENAKFRLPRSIQDLQHVSNTIIGFGYVLQAIPYLAALGNEVVVGIDHKKCSDFLLVGHSHTLSDLSGLAGSPGKYRVRSIDARQQRRQVARDVIGQEGVW